jgi:thymidylate synthase (FAD)
MKVILEPSVYVKSKLIFVETEDYPIPDDGDEYSKLGAFAAKGCYDSFGKDGRANEANQRQVMEHEHGSVLEHLHITLWITGITRALSLESNRHRPFNVSQRSTRYIKEEDSSIVLEPYYAELFKKYNPKLDNPWSWYYETDQATNTEQTLLLRFLNQSLDAINEYTYQVKLLEQLNPNGLTGFDLRKWARGKARNILPHSLETRITYTNNVRGWRWFIEARSDEHAEPEIRQLANSVLTTLKQEMPLYFEDFTVAKVHQGIPVWIPKYSKI